MPALYDRFPLKFKLPEQNGGDITEQDAFPGMVYYTSDSDVVLSSGFSSVFSNNFNVYSSSLAPRLIKYIPSLDVFSLVFYKGIYLYNPSVEDDNLSYESRRESIIFSATGGTSFILDSSNNIYFEGSYYSSDVNEGLDLNGVNRTSLNDNVDLYVHVGVKNETMPYFSLDGSYSGGSVAGLNYSIANSGFNIPDLDPGDFVPIFLRFEIQFNLDSNPVDYVFLNLSYNNTTNLDYFGSRETVPGITLASNTGDKYYNQSFAIRFDTNLANIKSLISGKVNLFYDNYPPFFAPLELEEVVPIVQVEEVVQNFTSTWTTLNVSSGSSPLDSIRLPLVSGGTYNFTVDWGDGIVDYIYYYGQPESTHVYSSPGTYVIKINGTINGWSFNNSGDKLKILNISQFGFLQLGTTGGAFNGCSNLTISAEDALNLTDSTSFTSAFRGTSSLTGIPSVSSWDVSRIETMNSMFRGSSFDQDISSWDYSGLNQNDALDNFFLDSSGLSIENYSLLLEKWDSYTSTNSIHTPMIVNMGSNTFYSLNSSVYRDSLISYGWLITDGGLPVLYGNQPLLYNGQRVFYGRS